MYESGDELFIKHLDKLKENAHYKRDVENNIQSNINEDIDADRLIFA